MSEEEIAISKAQISRAAIQRLNVAMKHLFIRGHYKPLGVSGEAMIKALLDLTPEIYGSIADSEKVELKGLLYVLQRLPQGIEECRYIHLISREGYENSNFKPVIPAKRRRNCYRIDKNQMNIEMTRGRSDIYDVLTHLTFLYIEAEKIMHHALDSKGRKKRVWKQLEQAILKLNSKQKINVSVGYSYLSTLLGRTYEETAAFAQEFAKTDRINSLFNIVYWLGYHSIQERLKNSDREISFSPSLRKKVGLHIFGYSWANKIKALLHEKNLLSKPIHIISANLHSVMNSIFAQNAIKKKQKPSFEKLIQNISKDEKLSKKVFDFAIKNGMYQIEDNSGTNITTQIFDLTKINATSLPSDLKKIWSQKKQDKVLIVMDYAFGEQAYECMDELLKPYEINDKKISLNIKSINIMGKAGILEGKKGDIMIPTAHIFEGSADNYPFNNSINIRELENKGIDIYRGPMVTVMGTSLQNEDILRYFLKSSWECIGLEMEGAHYQKAIQAASKIRNSIAKNVKLRYAYYASDNPLETGSTLASGGLGIDGVKPTYTITRAILKGILQH